MESKLSSVLRLALFAVLPVTAFALPAFAQNNPVPLINQPLVPAAAAPGGMGFTLTVNGTGFVSGLSVVNWNGSPRLTTFVSSSQVTASILTSDISVAGTAWVTVFNPSPGGGTSSVAFFLVTTPTASLTLGENDFFSSALSQSNSAVIGDFNGDGKIDFAAGSGGFVAIFLGAGNGTFSYGGSYSTGNNTAGLTTGDFNGDGKLDLAIVARDHTLSVLVGDGNGQFQSLPMINVGLEPLSVIAADLNGDGRLDLVVTDGADNGVFVLLGNGDGTFQAATFSSIGVAAVRVSAADFNGDGILDLAVTSPAAGTVSILLGNGDGTFQPHKDFATASDPQGIVVGDFNGDGKQDLATMYSQGVSILLGNGDGTFQPHVDYPTVSGMSFSSFAISLAMGDFNGDGRLDLAVANQVANPNASYYLAFLFGNGDGTFQSPVDYNMADQPGTLLAGDLNDDGRSDVIAVGVGSSVGPGYSVFLQIPVLNLSSTSLSFGDENIGMTSAPQMVTLSNIGSAPLNLTISITGQDPADFTQNNTCGTVLPSGASCAITVTFTPVVPGDLSAVVTITDNASGSPQSVALSGTGIGPFVTLSATSLAFPKQVVGTASQPKTVMLRNSGNQTLNITSIAATGDFLQMNTCGTSLPAGDICTIIVTFLPTRKGRRTGSITISDNAFGSPQTISLSGTGTVVKLSPKSLNFGSVQVGKVSHAKHVTLTNVGNTVLHITSIALTGADPRDFLETNTCGSSVTAGASCTIRIEFVPTMTGSRTAAVSITDDGGGSPQQIKLSGTGTLSGAPFS